MIGSSQLFELQQSAARCKPVRLALSNSSDCVSRLEFAYIAYIKDRFVCKLLNAAMWQNTSNNVAGVEYTGMNTGNELRLGLGSFGKVN